MHAAHPGWWFEERFWRVGISPVAGVDEAGRGALAGPIIAAAVILPHRVFPFKDSKRVSANSRERLAGLVKEEALAWGVGRSDASEIDRLGVLKATHAACKRALKAMSLSPNGLVTDYLLLEGPWSVAAPARADSLSLQAAAASLLAKTARDNIMATELEEQYPGYGFAQHKGYGASKHLAALQDKGPCPEHRLRFGPVAQVALFPKTMHLGVT